MVFVFFVSGVALVNQLLQLFQIIVLSIQQQFF